jgi:hypothetical protein
MAAVVDAKGKTSARGSIEEPLSAFAIEPESRQPRPRIRHRARGATQRGALT